jgi:hypothetical protein
LNGDRVTDAARLLLASDLIGGTMCVLRAGKKQHAIIVAAHDAGT